MTKAAKLTICLILLASASLPTRAQDSNQESPQTIAEQEAVRRQEATEQMRLKLAAARTAESRGRLEDAAKIYMEAYSLFPRVQVGNDKVEADKKAVVAEMSNIRLQLARTAAASGNYIEADRQLNTGLKYDQKNPGLLQAKKEIDKAAELSRGKVPSPEMVKTIPTIKKAKTDTAQMVQDAKFLYEAGKYDEAEAKLKEVQKVDPNNSAAFYYLDLVKEARYSTLSKSRESEAKTRIGNVTKSWIPDRKNEGLPIPNPMARTNLIYTTSARQAIQTKLEKIRLDNLDFNGIPLPEVLDQLSKISRTRDPDGEGINFMLNPHTDPFDSVADPTSLMSFSMSMSSSSGNGSSGGMGGGMGGGGMGGMMGGMGGMGRSARGANAGMGGVGAIGPDGMPIAAGTTTPAIDVKEVRITIVPAVRNLKLKDALDLICKVADQPISYSIEDYGIMFAPKTIESENVRLYVKTYHVDPNTFIQGLSSVTTTYLTDVSSGSSGSGSSGSSGNNNNSNGGSNSAEIGMVSISGDSNNSNGSSSGGGNRGGGGGRSGGGGNNGNNSNGSGNGLDFVTSPTTTADNNTRVKSYFASAGVDLVTTPGRSVFFNDRTGIILVRATLQEHEIIEAAIETLNVAPPQVCIEAKFAEITQEDSRAMGFDWYLGNFTIGGGKVGAQGGTAPSYTGASTTENPTGVFPGSSASTDSTGATTYPYAQAASASDSVLTSGLRNQYGSSATTIPAVGTVTGILTDPQFRVVIRAIEQRKGTDMLAAPKITTLSGRQAHMAVQDQVTLVTGLNTGSSSGAATTSSSTTTIGTSAASQSYNTQAVPLGPSLDVLPTVSADGYSVQMVLMPSIIEFIGYDDPGQFVPQSQSVSSSQIGVALSAVLPLPHMRVRQVVTSCIVWDGQTVVLGGLISESIQKIKDKVPFLGDIPYLGRLFRSESNSTTKKNLMIFVTPTIIDPAGNPAHSDDEMPFARNGIPAQPASTPTAAAQ